MGSSGWFEGFPVEFPPLIVWREHRLPVRLPEIFFSRVIGGGRRKAGGSLPGDITFSPRTIFKTLGLQPLWESVAAL